MRFELKNFAGGKHWAIQFFYGPSKDIQTLDLDFLSATLKRTQRIARAVSKHKKLFSEVDVLLRQTSPSLLQLSWTKRKNGPHPFKLADTLGEASRQIEQSIIKQYFNDQSEIEAVLLRAIAITTKEDEISGKKKFCLNAAAIIAGAIVGSWFNSQDWHKQNKIA